MKRALIVGIDDYENAPLTGCVNDAIAIANTLEKNGDGSPNFSVRQLVSNETEVTAEVLTQAVEDLFSGDAETVLLYFAGHGIINPVTNTGWIVSQDGRKGAWGMTLMDILALANKAYPRIKSTVIILDSCHSGFAGEVSALGNDNVAVIGNGVTILTACHREDAAKEVGGQGLFTSLLLDGLAGSSADILGRVTPASLYTHVDQTLSAWEQRPVYKANVQTFITLRQVAAKVPPEVIRRLPEYFPDPTYIFPLDPSFEPDRENVPDEFKHLPVNDENVRVFKELQLCNRYGLVLPVDAEHMYYAAINSTGCRLTAFGAHFRMVAERKRI